ncbi:MAG TPA: HAD family phosphatase [Candidatus Acidoferrum sp.]|nr:HAD family phosphatase [Candidatus Acidoferrum sp.]
MAAGKFRAVIFDIGRVLIRIDVVRAVKSLTSDRAWTPEELWSAIEKDPRWKDWQEGRIQPRDWHAHMRQRFGGPARFEEFSEAWNRVLAPEPIQDNEWLGKVAKKYRLALLSNTDPIHVAHMERSYDFFEHFRERVYSCAVGASKPNAIIFGKALQACRVRAEEAVYVDDIAEYAEAARRLGLAGIQYRSPEQLRVAFQELGLEI